MKKVTINFFSSQIDKSNGIGNMAFYLCDYLADCYNLRVFTNEVNDTLEKNIRWIMLSKTNVITRTLKGILGYLLNKKTDEVTLCMSWRLALVPYLCRHIKKTPYIVLCHGNEVLPDNVGKSNLVERILRKEILKNAAYISTNSKFTLSLVENICKLKNTTVIHPGCGEATHNNCEDGKYLLSIGRLEARKGFQYVIQAFDSLKDEYPDYNYYIIGDGYSRSGLQEIIDNAGIADRCKLLGRVNEDEKKRLLKNCSVLVMPSFIYEQEKSVEGFGIVYLEANAYGKPVVGTFSGGIPDAIINNETGLLVEPQNVKELSTAIRKILDGKTNIDEDKCKSWAKAHSYDQIVEQYFAIIKTVYEEYYQ